VNFSGKRTGFGQNSEESQQCDTEGAILNIIMHICMYFCLGESLRSKTEKGGNPICRAFFFYFSWNRFPGGEKMKYKLVTNNSFVHDEYSKPGIDKNLVELIYNPEDGFIETLKRVRDLVHDGHELLTHPLTGSVKPYETPYKSIAVSAKAGSLNMDSLKIIEDAIVLTQQFLDDYDHREFSERVYNDFRLIDYNLIKSGIESLNQFY